MTGIREMLEQDAEVVDLFAHVYGLTAVEKEVFRALGERERRATIDELTEDLGYERSTTYRAVQRLCRDGLAEKTQRNYADGGYCHVYGIADPETVTIETLETINELYAEMDRLIRACRTTYESRETRAECETTAGLPSA